MKFGKVLVSAGLFMMSLGLWFRYVWPYIAPTSRLWYRRPFELWFINSLRPMICIGLLAAVTGLLLTTHAKRRVLAGCMLTGLIPMCIYPIISHGSYLMQFLLDAIPMGFIFPFGFYNLLSGEEEKRRDMWLLFGFGFLFLASSIGVCFYTPLFTLILAECIGWIVFSFLSLLYYTGRFLAAIPISPSTKKKNT